MNMTIRLLAGLLAMAMTASASTADSIRVRVQDDKGAALSDGFILARSRGKEVSIPLQDDGVAIVSLPHPSRTEFVRLTALAENHVPAFVQYSLGVDWGDAAESTKPPTELAINLTSGTTIGGIVRDEAGQPIAGASVELFFQSADVDPRSSGTVQRWLWDYSVLTDANGHWSCTMALPTWRDPGFVRPRKSGYFTQNYLLPVKDREALLAGNEASTLTTGRSVSGRAITADGKPIAGATVMCDESINEHTPRVITDDRGGFRFDHVSPEYLSVIVDTRKTRPDLAVGVAPVPPGDDARVDVRVPVAATVRAQVVDRAGNPIANASATLTGWGDTNRADLPDNTVAAGADGRFQFTVPVGADATVIVSAPGYAYTRDVTIKSGAAEQRITLQRPTRIVGHVTDAQTGKPIQKFHVVGAVKHDGYSDEFGWSEADGSAGEYSLPFPEAVEGYRARVEAPGYAPLASKLLTPASDDEPMRFDAALVPASDLKGRVTASDGKPVSDARVMILTAESGYILLDNNARNNNAQDYKQAVTDAAGMFAAPPPGQPYDVLVAHDDAGWAIVPQKNFETNTTIALQPWAKIVGTIDAGHSKDVGNKLFISRRLTGASVATIDWNPHIVAAATGRFTFDRLPGEPQSVVWQLDPNNSSTSYLITPVVARSGETSTLALNPVGRPMSGRFVMPAGTPAEANITIATMTRMDAGAADANAVHVAFDPTDYWKADAPTYKLSVFQAPHAFRVNAQPGKYQLNVVAAVKTAGSYCGAGETVATLQREIVVEDSTSALDLGEMKLEPAPRIALGDAAPSFDCTTFDGTPLKAESFRGKFVVLDFWATWCGPCRAEMPFLKAAHDKFANDPRVTFISINLDDNVASAERFATENQITWTQGYGGAWGRSTVREAFKVGAIPAIFLIDPDGKIVAKDLRGEGIAKTIEKRLATK